MTKQKPKHISITQFARDSVRKRPVETVWLMLAGRMDLSALLAQARSIAYSPTASASAASAIISPLSLPEPFCTATA